MLCKLLALFIPKNGILKYKMEYMVNYQYMHSNQQAVFH